MELTPQQQKRVNGISDLIKDYMDLRFAHAARVNPNIAHVYDDVAWQELTTLRQVLRSTKSFGPVRYVVADILCSDDRTKVVALFNPVDQNSIMNEIIDEEEAARDQRAGILSIGSMRTLYRSLDPSLERILELIQTWAWWDLMDAALLFNFEQQLHRLSTLKSHEVTEKLEEFYKTVLKRPKTESVSKQEILDVEFKKLEGIVKQFAQRRLEDEGYKVIIKRDELPESELGTTIQNLSDHIIRLQKLEGAAGLDKQEQEHYSRLVDSGDDAVTLKQAIEYEKKAIDSLKNDLIKSFTSSRNLGEPYDYKQSQLRKLHEELEKARKEYASEEESAASS